jgi:hypothetical protein
MNRFQLRWRVICRRSVSFNDRYEFFALLGFGHWTRVAHRTALYHASYEVFIDFRYCTVRCENRKSIFFVPSELSLPSLSLLTMYLTL